MDKDIIYTIGTGYLILLTIYDKSLQGKVPHKHKEGERTYGYNPKNGR
jgi:hypothetical protein